MRPDTRKAIDRLRREIGALSTNGRIDALDECIGLLAAEMEHMSAPAAPVTETAPVEIVLTETDIQHLTHECLEGYYGADPQHVARTLLASHRALAKQLARIRETHGRWDACMDPEPNTPAYRAMVAVGMILGGDS